MDLPRRTQSVSNRKEHQSQIMDNPGPLMQSGGAEGSDYEWAVAALRAGCRVRAVSFAKHACRAPPGCVVYRAPQASLNDALLELEDLAGALKRPLPKQPGYIRNLLLRNILLARNVDAVYAVASIRGSFEKGVVDGGTAWACYYHVHTLEHPKLFVFDTLTECWVAYQKGATPRWVECLPPSPATFAGGCALVGTRELTLSVKEAINNVW